MRQIPRQSCARPDRALDTGCNTGARVCRCPEFLIRGAAVSGQARPAWRQEFCLNRLPRVAALAQAWQQPDVSAEQRRRELFEEAKTPAPRREQLQRIFSYRNIFRIYYSCESLTHSLRIVRGRRQNRWLVGGTFLLLYFHFRNQNRWSNRSDGYGARLRTAVAVENFRRVTGGHNFGERYQRCADNVHASDQLVGVSIRENFVHYKRLHLERLRLAAAGERGTSGDIVNQQAECFSLTFDFLDQFFAQLSVGDHEAALNDQVSLTGDRLSADLPSAMAVRARKFCKRLPRHLEIAQNPFVHQGNALGGSALIIKGGVADHDFLSDRLHGRIVIDRKKWRKNRFANLARESLSFADIFLAKAFGAMPEHFMEENGGSAAGEKRR